MASEEKNAETDTNEQILSEEPTSKDEGETQATNTHEEEKNGTNDEMNRDDTLKSDELNRETSKSSKSSEDKTRVQMIAELERLRKEMVTAASTIERPKLKPYSPDIFNSLSPYYNKYLIDYCLKDQDPCYDSWGSFGQRETALNIVDPETSLKMDNFPLPVISSKNPGQLYRMKIWSKNLSGKDGDMGSTRLPPIPSLAVKKLENPEYQHFSMTYDEVPKFRQDVKKMYTAIDEKRKKADYERVQKDWRRMNLTEMKELPEKSRYHYGKAISTYLGTSKGSMKAVHSLARQLNTGSDE